MAALSIMRKSSADIERSEGSGGDTDRTSLTLTPILPSLRSVMFLIMSDFFILLRDNEILGEKIRHNKQIPILQ